MSAWTALGTRVRAVPVQDVAIVLAAGQLCGAVIGAILLSLFDAWRPLL